MKHPLKLMGLIFGLALLWGCSAAPTEPAPVQQAARPTAPAQTQETQVTQAPLQNTATPTTVAEAELDNETSPTEEAARPAESNPTAEATSTVTPPPTDTPTAIPAKPTEAAPEEAAPEMDNAAGIVADVISVGTRGEPGSYNFSVEISSPDTGCEQFADWWEVLSEDGQLLYRRILLHSHVTEQPFVRSGGPVEIAADEVVWVRAHMNIGGYGGQVFKGSAAAGFQPAEPGPSFASGVENLDPLPTGCAF